MNLPENDRPTATATACDAYCDKHAVCRLLNNQPVHYFDCDRFETYNYGLKQGRCDCTATADVNEVLDAHAATRQEALPASSSSSGGSGA